MDIDKLTRRLTMSELVIRALLTKKANDRFVERKLASLEELITEIPEERADLLQEWEGRLVALWSEFADCNNSAAVASKPIKNNLDSTVSSIASNPTGRNSQHIPPSFQPFDSSSNISSSPISSPESSFPVTVKPPPTKPCVVSSSRIPQRSTEILDVSLNNNRQIQTYQSPQMFSQSMSSFSENISSPRSAALPTYGSINSSRLPSNRGRGRGANCGYKPRDPHQDPQQRAHVKEVVINGIRDMFEPLPVVDRFTTIGALRQFANLVEKADQGLSKGQLYKSKYIHKEVMNMILPKLAADLRELFLKTRVNKPIEVRWLRNFLNAQLSDPEGELNDPTKQPRRLMGVECDKCGQVNDHFAKDCIMHLIDRETNTKQTDDDEWAKSKIQWPTDEWALPGAEVEKRRMIDQAVKAEQKRLIVQSQPKPSTSEAKVDDPTEPDEKKEEKDKTDDDDPKPSEKKWPRISELNQECEEATRKQGRLYGLEQYDKFNEYLQVFSARIYSLEMNEYTSSEGLELMDSYHRLMKRFNENYEPWKSGSLV